MSGYMANIPDREAPWSLDIQDTGIHGLFEPTQDENSSTADVSEIDVSWVLMY